MQETLLKRRVLEHFLPSSSFDGWNDTALQQAVTAVGLDAGYMEVLFPNGVETVTSFYLSDLEEGLQRYRESTPGFDTLKRHEKIRLLLIERLRLMAPHKQAAKQLAAWLHLPAQTTFASACLWHTADGLWRLAGDKSADFSYYTRRLMLGAVYGSIFLYWLQDTSEDTKDTLAFLDRRLENVGQFHQIKNNVSGALLDAIRMLRWER